MNYWDVFLQQIADPFRIGLMIALVYTSISTGQQAGRVIPLALGVIFVAAMIPVTLRSETVDTTTAIVVGLVTNTIMLAVLLAAVWLWNRFRPAAGG